MLEPFIVIVILFVGMNVFLLAGKELFLWEIKDFNLLDYVAVILWISFIMTQLIHALYTY